MKSRAFWLPCIAAVALVLSTSAPANSVVEKQLAWKNCDTTVSALRAKSTYTVLPDLTGAGKYYISIEIRWDLYKGDGAWRVRDSHSGTSLKFTVKQDDTYWFTLGDRTTWGNAYSKRWRAHVISKLKKVRTGPDRTIQKEDRFYHKGMFAERDCATPGGL